MKRSVKDSVHVDDGSVPKVRFPFILSPCKSMTMRRTFLILFIYNKAIINMNRILNTTFHTYTANFCIISGIFIYAITVIWGMAITVVIVSLAILNKAAHSRL